jgi:hypothetical protein
MQDKVLKTDNTKCSDINSISISCCGGTAIAQWLRYCAKNQNVPGSIPDGVMEYFIDINLSDRCMMALGSTQPLTEMSTRSIFWVVYAAGA